MIDAEKDFIAGCLWLALLTSIKRDHGRLLNEIERLLGSQTRSQIEKALYETPNHCRHSTNSLPDLRQEARPAR